jgi:DNA polymerase-3 subunit delta'
MVVDARTPLPWLRQPLQQALAQQRAHALLVHASEGNGALQFMLSLATAWLCEGEDAPCGHCTSCHLVLNHSHPDLHLLLPEAQRAGWTGDDNAADGAKSKRKPSRQIRIDELRAAIDWIVHTSSRGRAKVFLLYPAEAMNHQSASALLKTLEEPPGQARIVLGAAQPDRLLPTLRSRCQTLHLPAPSAEQAVAWLAQQQVGDAAVLLAACDGQPLQAAALAAMGVDAKAWLALPKAAAAGQVGAFAGWPVPRVLDALIKLCHDAMAVAAGGPARYFSTPSLPPHPPIDALVRWSSSLARVARHAEHPWNEGLLIEALVNEARITWEDATVAGTGNGGALATLRR